MRATQVLQRCLQPALAPMHALRRRTLLAAVEALLSGRRLVLIWRTGSGSLFLRPDAAGTHTKTCRALTERLIGDADAGAN
jgi:hypothetical protein